MSDGWFPKLNGRGEVVSGSAEIVLNGQSLGPGNGPQWLDDDTLVWGRGGGSVLLNRLTGEALEIPGGYNERTAGGGIWYGWQAGAAAFAVPYTGVVPGERLPDIAAPRLSAGGTYVAWAAPYQAVDRELWCTPAPGLAPVLVARDRIMEVSVCEQALVWLSATGKYTRAVYGRVHGGTATAQRVFDWESPQVIDGPDGPWILSLTQRGLILRPWSSSVGYRWEGEYFNPDARFLDGRFVIVSSSGAGAPQRMDVQLSDARRELRGTEPSIEAPPPIVVVPPPPPPGPTEPPVDPPAPGGARMDIPAIVIQNIKDISARHQDLAHGDEDQRRAQQKLICEQNRFDLGPAWGWKSASQQRPPGKDAIAYAPNGNNGPVWVADVFDGSSRAYNGATELESTDQWFIAVEPIDHLGHGGITEPVKPDVPPGPVLVPPSQGDLAGMRAAIAAQGEQIDAQELRLDVQDAAHADQGTRLDEAEKTAEGVAHKGDPTTSHVGRLNIPGSINK